MSDTLKKIYIAGKISGLLSKEYIEKFEIASFKLKLMGYEPINPVELCSDIKNGKWFDYMDRCIKILPKCDGIYMLNDWKDSVGARVERLLADGIKSTENPDFLILEQE